MAFGFQNSTKFKIQQTNLMNWNQHINGYNTCINGNISKTIFLTKNLDSVDTDHLSAVKYVCRYMIMLPLFPGTLAFCY